MSQILTLYTTPVIYLYMERLGRRARAASSRRRASRGRSARVDAVNISAPFIRRPIATSLLAAALLLAGARRVHAAAGGAAAARRLPDDQRQRGAARRQPADDGVGGGDAARAPLRPHRRRHRDDLDERRSARRSITLQFDLDRDVEAAARDVQAAINAAGGELPPNLPFAPELPQGQPGRRADPDLLAALQDAAAVGRLRGGQHRPRAEDLAGARRRAGRSSAAGSSRRCACRPIRRRCAGAG